MKILHIHPAMAGGGCEAMICGLANEMAKTQDVIVCSIFEPKDTDIFWFKLSSKIKKKSLGKVEKGFSLKEIYKVYKFIQEQNFDIVYLHGFIQYYILAVLLLHNRVKFCYTLHTDAKMENSGWSGRLSKFKKIFFIHNWITPITISYASQKSFHDLYQCDSKLIFNGVPKPQISHNIPDVIQKYKHSRQTKVFLHPGRITEAKNQVILCNVFNQLIGDGEDVILLIAGPNDDRSIFSEIEPFLCDRIIYLGQRSDIPQLLAYSDAMCLPSIWEGLPVTLLEALSVGCVPICSPVGGIVDVIKCGDNGLLSKSSSRDDYYVIMKRYLNMTEDEIFQMKRKCSESFKKYDIVNTAKEYLKVAL